MSSQRSGSHSFSASKSSTAFSADSSDTAASFRRPLREEACQMAVCGGHRQHLGELRTFIADIRPSGATPGSPDRCASQAGGGFWLQAWSTRKDVLRARSRYVSEPHDERLQVPRRRSAPVGLYPRSVRGPASLGRHSSDRRSRSCTAAASIHRGRTGPLASPSFRLVHDEREQRRPKRPQPAIRPSSGPCQQACGACRLRPGASCASRRLRFKVRKAPGSPTADR